MNKRSNPSLTFSNRPVQLTKEQMVRQMREAAANTAKVKAPRPKKAKKP